MNLVIQGEDISTPDLKELHRLSRGAAIERISDEAFRITRADPGTKPQVAEHAAGAKLDFGFVEEGRALRDFGLLAMDMDSTLISIECIDEIADFAGRKAEVAAVTASAMRGEIDWPESLRRRVKCLAGLDAESLARVYDDRLRLNRGAEKLLAAAKLNGVKTLLVSGGFTYFTDRVRDKLGFDYAYSNNLDIQDAKLTGTVSGPLVDAAGKAAHVVRICKELGLARERVIAIGDGANDLPMMAEAGTSIAYHAKPVVKDKVDYVLDFAGLDGVLKLFPEA
jgi:phosphoserine phosphatase